jgi:hypothetical protein
MNPRGSATVSPLHHHGGGKRQHRQRQKCHQHERPGRAAAETRPALSAAAGSLAHPSRDAGAREGPAVFGVAAGMAVPAEHGDVAAALVSSRV